MIAFKKLVNFIKGLCLTMPSNSISVLDVTERPIFTTKEDCFDAELRIVNRIYGFIQDVSAVQLTMAITGGWGEGKSSVINLLANKLRDDKKNIIINFEPLLEGKLEIADIMSSFYMKLYQNLTNPEAKTLVKKCLKSVAILSRAKITGNAELDGGVIGISGAKFGGTMEYNWSDNVDALLKLWDTQEPNNFSKQTMELNNFLKSINCKLYIVIDEIDRLPAYYIIQFLLFCRILETFDNLICIVGIDYEQVINKLKGDDSLHLSGYELAQGYLDKLFQCKFHVHHNKYKKIEFARNRLIELDRQNILREILSSTDYKVQGELEDIFTYLSTPRQIKKWIISVVVNYSILKHSPDKLCFMAFLAVTVKHPIISDYMSRHALKLMTDKHFLIHAISKQYGVDFVGHEDERTKIIIASLGLQYSSRRQNAEFEKSLTIFMGVLKVQQIKDDAASRYLADYLNTPRYLIALFLEGFADEGQVALISKFFSAEIDDAISSIMVNDSNVHMLVSDLAEMLQKGYGNIQGAPKISLLNALWLDKIDSADIFGNPYEVIILFCLRRLPLEVVISDSSVTMSEAHISSILYVCQIENLKDNYDLSGFKVPSDEDIVSKGFQGMQYNGVILGDYKQSTISEILKCWIAVVEAALDSKDTSVYSQPKLISVFYRYVQWSHAINRDVRKKLSDYVIRYLKDSHISSSDKDCLKNAIKAEQEKFDCKNWGIEINPMETLFDNNHEVLQFISVSV